MNKLIVQISFTIFLILHFVYGNSDNPNQTNKNSVITIVPANTNSIVGSTESTIYVNPSIKPYTTLQNSIYSKTYPTYKFSASTPVLSPISPTYQTNFQPMGIQSGPTPVIMQYLPQSHGGGVQYLQLIPTRPLIVPISPYITQPGTYPQISNHLTGRSLIRPIINGPNPAGTSSHPLYTPGSLIGGYATNIPNFRNFRPNKGMVIIPGPDDLNLNRDEYLPAANDSPTLNRVTRGRP